jgi:hypothetical protein
LRDWLSSNGRSRQADAASTGWVRDLRWRGSPAPLYRGAAHGPPSRTLDGR